MVPVKGLEPLRPIGQQILSLQRLPFRHTGICSTGKSNIEASELQEANFTKIMKMSKEYSYLYHLAAFAYITETRTYLENIFFNLVFFCILIFCILWNLSMNEEKRNLFLFFIISMFIMVGYPYFLGNKDTPVTQQNNIECTTCGSPRHITNKEVAVKKGPLTNTKIENIKINSGRISGTICSKGTMFNDIRLKDYKKNLDGEEKVSLFSDENSKNYFVQTEWFSDDHTILLPNEETCWEVSGTELSENSPITFTWDNGEGLKFEKKISIDDNFLITIEDRVYNYGKTNVKLKNIKKIHRELINQQENLAFYEGPLGCFDDKIQEIKYEDIAKKGEINCSGKSSWFGFTDKYWLVSFIPNKSQLSGVKYEYTDKNAYTILGTSKETLISPNGAIIEISYLYLGAKEIKTLDMYEKKLSINHFDLALDFGYFYILTKPLLYLSAYMKDIVGNMGLAIILVTLLLKILLFPLANKSYRSMNKMRDIQPKIQLLQKKYGNDKIKLGQAVSELYRKEKVNPIGGCLPLLLQWPILIALYKVLYISIEMRQAPFIGWIHDLSQADPLTIFNLFGLLPITLPGFLQIGVWPLIMGITMIIQQKLSPAPADPAQEKMLFAIPIIFTFMFAQFPAGLVIYWTFSNLLGILQQYYLIKTDGKKFKQK